MTDITSIFHKNFDRLFRKGKWSEGKFAAAAGLDPSRVHRYLKGTNSPSLENIEKIAKVFKISISELVTEKGNPIAEKINELRNHIAKLEVDRTELMLQNSKLSMHNYNGPDDYPPHDYREEKQIDLQKQIEFKSSQIKGLRQKIDQLQRDFPELTHREIEPQTTKASALQALEILRSRLSGLEERDECLLRVLTIAEESHWDGVGPTQAVLAEIYNILMEFMSWPERATVKPEKKA